jgi:hypothetical protein
MRGLPLASVIALGSMILPVHAESQSSQNGLPKLMREGWGFSCRLNKEQSADTQRLGLSADAACGQVGPLWLGMDRASAEKVLGPPTTARNFGSSIFYVYSLQVDETKQMITNAVIAFDSKDRVSSIQITGVPWSGAWTFADIKLGDTGKAVVARLGEPHGISLSGATSTLVWDYLPWTFSFEIKGTIVSSIRVADR